MTVKYKIILGFGLSLLLLFTVGMVGYRSTNSLTETAAHRQQVHRNIHVLDDLLSSLKDAETGQRGYLLTGNPLYLEPYTNGIKAVDERLVTLDEILAEASGRRQAEELKAAVSGKLAELKLTIDLRREKGVGPALAVVDNGTGKKFMDETRAIVARLRQGQDELLKERQQAMLQTASATKSVILSATVLAIVLVLIFGTIIVRAVTRPLQNFMSLVEKVGQGDLTKEADDSATGEFAQLGRSLNQMIGGLRSLAQQTRTATANLNSATAQIVASTQEQAASTGEQAAAVQETTVTMDEIRQSGVQIAERARQVAAAAQDTAASSSDGLLAVQNTGRAMESIREQAEAVAENIVRLSEKTQFIGEIIATVNDIAEQSHLLALNAAIEAAAAGEHGRSFAVVASEIKNLADQSKEATVQVRSSLSDIQRGINSSVMLTEEAVKRIESGKQYSEAADRTIRRMADNIQQSVQAFQQIVAGSNQQHIGFEQVLQAVKNIGQASQQTAIATRQLEKAAGHLNALGEQLESVGDIYRI